MSLTQEQIDNEVQRLIDLAHKAEECEEGDRKCFQYTIVSLVIGIFFFPLLVVAVIFFLCHRNFKEKAKLLNDEIQRTEPEPEVKERLKEMLLGDNNPNP